MAIFVRDALLVDQAGVAVRADFVIARLRVLRDGAGALVAVVSAVCWQDGVAADLACRREGQRFEVPEADGVGSRVERRASRTSGKPGAARRGMGARGGRDVGQREEGMRAAFALVDAIIAEAPVALVARLAPPEAFVGPGKTPRAEHAAL